MSWQDRSPLLIYPLLIPHIASLCIRYKTTPAIIAKANPLFPFGGLPFASKHQMIKNFKKVIPYTIIRASSPEYKRLSRARRFASKYKYPIILKPDTGHRGVDIRLLKNQKELDSAILDQRWDYIIQEYNDYPEEFGIFYYREPGMRAGKIISITRKEIPILEGDGKRTIKEIIENSNAIVPVKQGSALLEVEIVANQLRGKYWLK
ncbi:hypothetical protein D6825_03720, partial [Candidatus Woesearchaeota archaeon]